VRARRSWASTRRRSCRRSRKCSRASAPGARSSSTARTASTSSRPRVELGIERCAPEDLRGGTADENAANIREVFAGGNGGRKNAILLNAAGAIAAGGHAKDLAEGIGYAREALDSGAAGERLEALIAFSKLKAPG